MVKLPAKTLAETLVAMVIIMTVLALWSRSYIAVSSHDNQLSHWCARNLLIQNKVNSITSFSEVEACGLRWEIEKKAVGKDLWLVTLTLADRKPKLVYYDLVYESEF